jgi:hypothetical protein
MLAAAAAKRAGKGKKPKKRGKKRGKRAAVIPVIPPMVSAPKKRGKKRGKKRATKRAAPRKTAKRVVKAKPRQTASMCVRVAVPQTPKRRAKRRKKNLANPMPQGLMLGGGDGYLGMGLFENPVGPFNAGTLRALAVTGAGVGLGLAFADFTDRWVATRGPKYAWQGRDAAAAQARRPDAWRLGAQAGGGVIALAATYYSRGRGILPFVLGGITIGFVGNLGKMLVNWYIIPAVGVVDDYSKKSFWNRMYPVEQKKPQDTVAAYFENKNKAQEASDEAAYTPVSPLSSAGLPPAEGPMYLGKAREAAEQGNLVATGRLGACGSCNGMNGCYSSCPDLVLCDECGSEGLVARRCAYTVKQGDDLYAMARSAGVDINQVNALNGGGDPSTYWTPGARVILPFAMCMYLERESTPSIPADDMTTKVVEPEQPPPEPVLTATPALPRAPTPTRVADIPTAMMSSLAVHGFPGASKQSILLGIGTNDDD